MKDAFCFRYYAWEQRKLGSMISTLNAGISVNSTELDTGAYILKTSAVKLGRLNLKENKPIVESEIRRAKLTVEPRSIIVSRMNTPELVGASALSGVAMKNVFLPDRLWQAKIHKEINGKWLISSLNTPKNIYRIHAAATGTSGSMKNISKLDMLGLVLSIPKQEEQNALGEILTLIDKAIALHQRKFESPKFNLLKGITCFVLFRATQTVLKIVKMYYVWEQRKLGKVSSLSDIDHRMPTSQTTGIPYLMTGNFLPDGGLDFQNAKKISEPDYENLAKKAHPKRGDIIMARYASVGAVRYVETNQRFLVSYSCTIIRPSSIIDGRYLYHALQAGVVQKQIQINKKTGSQANIGMNDLKNLIKLRVAPISEQHKIADIFTSIDKTIALHQRKHSDFRFLSIEISTKSGHFSESRGVVTELKLFSFALA
jgi:type I restriction enzyme S subunit